MRKYLIIWLCNRSHLNHLIHEENFLFIFLSEYWKTQHCFTLPSAPLAPRDNYCTQSPSADVKWWRFPDEYFELQVWYNNILYALDIHVRRYCLYQGGIILISTILKVCDFDATEIFLGAKEGGRVGGSNVGLFYCLILFASRDRSWYILFPGLPPPPTHVVTLPHFYFFKEVSLKIFLKIWL